MSTRKIQEIFLRLPELSLPERSDLVAWAELVEMTAVTPDCMAEIVELGWVNPMKTQAENYLFRRRDVYRIRKLVRLTNDLGVSALGASIIVDLVERVEELEKEIEELRRLV